MLSAIILLSTLRINIDRRQQYFDASFSFIMKTRLFNIMALFMAAKTHHENMPI